MRLTKGTIVQYMANFKANKEAMEGEPAIGADAKADAALGF